jgi:hypothetical protein
MTDFQLTCEYDSSAINTHTCVAQVQDYSSFRGLCFFRQCRIKRKPNATLCTIHTTMQAHGASITQYAPVGALKLLSEEEALEHQDLDSIFHSINRRLRDKMQAHFIRAHDARELLRVQVRKLEHVANANRKLGKWARQQTQSNKVKSDTKSLLRQIETLTTQLTLIPSLEADKQRLQARVVQLETNVTMTAEQVRELKAAHVHEQNSLQQALAVMRTTASTLANQHRQEVLQLRQTCANTVNDKDASESACAAYQISEQAWEKRQVQWNNDEKALLEELQAVKHEYQLERAHLKRQHEDLRVQLAQEKAAKVELAVMCKESWKIMAQTTLQTMEQDAQRSHARWRFRPPPSTDRDSGNDRDSGSGSKGPDDQPASLLEEVTVSVPVPPLPTTATVDSATLSQDSKVDEERASSFIRASGGALTMVRVRAPHTPYRPTNSFRVEQDEKLAPDNTRKASFVYTLAGVQTVFQSTLVGGSVWVDGTHGARDANEENQQIFDKFVSQNIQDYLLAEANAYTLLTYGQSGSGKTHTMDGVMQRTLDKLLHDDSPWCATDERIVKVDIQEYYLGSTRGAFSTTQVFTRSTVHTFSEILQRYRDNDLKITATPYNAKSSRSHVVVLFRLGTAGLLPHDKKKEKKVPLLARGGLAFVDLAGSENLADMSVLSVQSTYAGPDRLGGNTSPQERVARMQKTYASVRNIDKVVLHPLTSATAGEQPRFKLVLVKNPTHTPLVPEKNQMNWQRHLLDAIKQESVHINRDLLNLSTGVSEAIAARQAGTVLPSRPTTVAAQQATFVGGLIERIRPTSAAFQFIATMSPAAEVAYLHTTETSVAFLNNLAGRRS